MKHEISQLNLSCMSLCHVELNSLQKTRHGKYPEYNYRHYKTAHVFATIVT